MSNILTVEYDLSEAVKEGKIRDKLIDMGWTPPPDEPKTYYANAYPNGKYGPLYTTEKEAKDMISYGGVTVKLKEVKE